MYLTCSQKKGDSFPYTELTDFVIEFLIARYEIETHFYVHLLHEISCFRLSNVFYN
jgi:hypothetical protein